MTSIWNYTTILESSFSRLNAGRITAKKAHKFPLKKTVYLLHNFDKMAPKKMLHQFQAPLLPKSSLRAPPTARFLFPRPSTNLLLLRDRRLNRPVGTLWLYGLTWCWTVCFGILKISRNILWRNKVSFSNIQSRFFKGVFSLWGVIQGVIQEDIYVGVLVEGGSLTS